MPALGSHGSIVSLAGARPTVVPRMFSGRIPSDASCFAGKQPRRDASTMVCLAEAEVPLTSLRVFDPSSKV